VTAEGTDYHIFIEKDNGGSKTYEPAAANVPAISGTAAIRKIAKAAGVYVAIPARSFKPVKVTVHTETTIRLG
jgi:hypothetical protein